MQMMFRDPQRPSWVLQEPGGSQTRFGCLSHGHGGSTVSTFGSPCPQLQTRTRDLPPQMGSLGVSSWKLILGEGRRGEAMLGRRSPSRPAG